MVSWAFCFALWTYWHIEHLNLVSQSRAGTTTNVGQDIETGTTPHHIVKTRKNNGKGKPFWETIFVSATHCGAGCTLGDVISEWGVFIAGTTVAGLALIASYKSPHPKILFLVDRDVLITQAMDGDFSPFGQARHRIQQMVQKAYEMYFALYQALDVDKEESELYKRILTDFFDYVIIDECHRETQTILA